MSESGTIDHGGYGGSWDDREDEKFHVEVHMELGVMTSEITNRFSSCATLSNSVSECTEKWAAGVVAWIIPTHLDHYAANSHLLR